MNKKTFTPAIIFLILAVVAIIFVAKSETGTKETNNAVKSDLIFFYGDGCPHCAVVESYFEDNQVESKIDFSKREVYNNQANATLLTTKAKICGLNTNSIGVPFLWDGANCLIGDRDIIAFFDTELATLDSLKLENGIEIESFNNKITSEPELDNFESATTSTETNGNIEIETNEATEATEVELETLNKNQ